MKDTKEERAEFAKVIFGLAEEFGGKIAGHNINIKFAALKEYSIEQIRQAGTWLIKNRKETFPAIPTTKEIIDAIGIVTTGNNQGAAELELDKIFSKIRRFGRDAQPLFLDDTTRYLMTSRWTMYEVANMDINKLGFFKRDFVKAYNGMKESKITPLIAHDPKNTIPAKNLKKLIPEKMI